MTDDTSGEYMGLSVCSILKLREPSCSILCCGRALKKRQAGVIVPEEPKNWGLTMYSP